MLFPPRSQNCFHTTCKIGKTAWSDYLFLPASPKAEAGLGFAFSVRTSVPERQYLLSVICNSNSFQLILFKLCTVFVYILKMCTSHYHGLIWRFFSYIFCMPNLVIFYHYMSWTVPSWCNLKLQVFNQYYSYFA
jgi:hypothetical protein